MTHPVVDLFHGLFHLHVGPNGRPSVSRVPVGASSVPCPSTGRLLRVSTVDADAPAICPRCTVEGRGGFVTFVGDLRMAYACPECRELVWTEGL